MRECWVNRDLMYILRPPSARPAAMARAAAGAMTDGLVLDAVCTERGGAQALLHALPPGQLALWSHPAVANIMGSLKRLLDGNLIKKDALHKYSPTVRGVARRVRHVSLV
jgi:hypothetical protein